MIDWLRSAACSALGLWILAQPLPCAAAEEKLITGAFADDMPPYLWRENGVVKGVQIEILRAALEPKGYKVEGVALPIRRIWGTFGGSKLDFAAGVGPVMLPGACYSDEFIEYHDVAISKTARGIHLDTPSDLFKYRVISWQGAEEGLGLDSLRRQIGAPTGFMEAPDTESQIRFFRAGRADVIVIDRYIFEAYARLMAGEDGTTEPLTIAEIFPTQIKARVAFRDKALCDDFNEGLRRIRADGDYDLILARHIQR